MILYHFTAPHLAASIQKEGITRGFVPDYVGGKIVLRPNLISLTVDSRFAAQDWCENSTLPYDRAAVRFTIAIPRAQEDKVIHWLQFCNNGGIHEKMAAILNEFGSPQSWRLWRGQIPVEWICNIQRKPVLIQQNAVLLGT